MKKICILLLSLALLLSLLSACGKAELSEATSSSPEDTTQLTTETTEPPAPKEKPLRYGEEIKTDNFSLSFNKTEMKEKFEFVYKSGGFTRTNSLPSEEGKQTLALIGTITNTGNAPLDDNFLGAQLYVNDAQFKTEVRFMDEANANSKFSLDPLESVSCYIYVQLPPAAADALKTFRALIYYHDDLSYAYQDVSEMENVYVIEGFSDGKGAAADTSAEQATPSAAQTTASLTTESSVKTLKIGEAISTEEYSFTVNKVEFTYELLPPNTSGYYYSYEPESGKVYIHVDGTYKNLSKTSACIRDLPVFTADYNNGFTYNGSVVVNDGDSNFDWVSSYVVAEPLSSCHYHCLIECPKEVESEKAPLVLTVPLGGTSYQYTVR